MTIGIGVAQQREQYTNYIMNNFVVNPAVAGSYSFWNAKMGYRTQWVGLGDGVGPKTFFTSIHGPIGFPDPRRHKRSKVPHQGVGGYVYHDETGPISYTGVFGAYSYHQKVNNLYTLSAGAFGGVKQFSLNNNELYVVQSEFDNLISNGISRLTVPDMNVGLFLYSDHLFVGASAHQILRSRLKFQGANTGSMLKNHYFVTGGVKMQLSREVFLYPTIIVKSIAPSPLSVDLNARVLYDDFFWAGISYRHRDAVAIIGEYVINDFLEIGYSYDLTLSRIRRFSYGTHEIIIGFRWANSRKEVHCPSKYW